MRNGIIIDFGALDASVTNEELDLYLAKAIESYRSTYSEIKRFSNRAVLFGVLSLGILLGTVSSGDSTVPVAGIKLDFDITAPLFFYFASIFYLLRTISYVGFASLGRKVVQLHRARFDTEPPIWILVPSDTIFTLNRLRSLGWLGHVLRILLGCLLVSPFAFAAAHFVVEVPFEMPDNMVGWLYIVGIFKIVVSIVLEYCVGKLSGSLANKIDGS